MARRMALVGEAGVVGVGVGAVGTITPAALSERQEGTAVASEGRKASHSKTETAVAVAAAAAAAEAGGLVPALELIPGIIKT